VRHRTTLLPATAVLVVTVLLLGGTVTPSTATPPTDDPVTAAGYGARWLTSQLTPGGYVADGNGDPSPGPTAGVALALAAARVPELAGPLGWLRGNVDAHVAPGGTDSAGNLAYLIILAVAAGEDPSSFGGTDLVSRLEGTVGAFEPGLFGAADPTFDGAFRQSLALLALAGAGRTPPPAAVTWLVDQQCGAESPASTVGGWEAYRSDPGAPCTEPDPVNYLGADTNSTAMAVQAAAALGVALDQDPLAFLDRAQGDDGGFPFVAGGDVDPNSTALVVQALVAADQDLRAAPWGDATGDPLTSLLSWQIGCDAPAADQGALASPFSDGAPDLFATQQGVWGLALTPFPLPPADPLTPAPTPCEPIPGPIPTTAPADGASGATPTSAAAATAVTPRFAG
jgi:hypothetical protein